ncbi:DUF5018 domain-containing protein [Flagellimonas sp. HMM57]|uniref:leucine-rich repeat domain-containing protein n=1 Tax=unclassified Flagellimonas TaxID=2644544 RepID=UPI0013D7344B|nr:MULTISPECIES: DUF5018 domain-containing protein [unclassified Flagellimonas]UII77375.1 DUF5018 domain-containing protein [Flagellimonas sp. HMM57]
MKKLSILFLSLFVLVSCSKDDDNDNAKSSARAITAFVFAATANEALTEDVKAKIDEDGKAINAEVPFGTNITALKPTITVSEGAKVSPDSKAVKDFTEEVEYMVTAEDGSTDKYLVNIGIATSGAKEIMSFVFLAEDNAVLSEDVQATINEDEKTIIAEVPSGTDVTALVPNIEISAGAKVAPNSSIETDFSKTVTYMVTANDESSIEYTVTVNVALSDREVLVALYNANPGNTLDWDLEEQDLSQWSGVELNADGRVYRLNIGQSNIGELPPEIKYLKALEILLASSNELQNIPKELGSLIALQRISIGNNRLLSEIPEELASLKKLKGLYASSCNFNQFPRIVLEYPDLEDLSLSENKITGLPANIGQLQKLKRLELASNQIAELPNALSELESLESLFLFSNQLTNLPSNIGNLKNLQRLELSRNEGLSIPQSIGSLSSLTILNLGYSSITTLPDTIGNLSNLELLDVQHNALTGLPDTLGDLSNLQSLILSNNELVQIPDTLANLFNINFLDLRSNQITMIPKAICDLGIQNFFRDSTAICEQ